MQVALCIRSAGTFAGHHRDTLEYHLHSAQQEHHAGDQTYHGKESAHEPILVRHPPQRQHRCSTVARAYSGTLRAM
ncbi:hypothetical protein G6F46_015828 [Rhizopus delemar]|nr:hypothetical protein G6F40_017316 [Rhizopus arrhizus]KAG1577673.1 hypothetical protein G6F46_015828 [Rhizopus delemar]